MSPTVRFSLFFAALLIGPFVLVNLAPDSSVLVRMNSVVAAVASWGAEAIGLGEVTARGSTILLRSGESLAIRNGCNGVHVTILFLAATLAFPAPWRAKLAGVVIGTTLIFAMNQIRVVAILATAMYYPSYVNYAHVYVGQTIAVLFVAVVWITWIRSLAPKTATGSSMDSR